MQIGAARRNGRPPPQISQSQLHTVHIVETKLDELEMTRILMLNLPE